MRNVSPVVLRFFVIVLLNYVVPIINHNFLRKYVMHISCQPEFTRSMSAMGKPEQSVKMIQN